MSLEEKRIFKQLKEVTLPRYQRDLDAIVGSPLPYDVDWDGFAGDLDALTHLEERLLTEVQSAVQTICRDDLGKEAVRAQLKQIRVTNLAHFDCDEITIREGTLYMACDWGNGSRWVAESIVARVESLL